MIKNRNKSVRMQQEKAFEPAVKTRLLAAAIEICMLQNRPIKS